MDHLIGTWHLVEWTFTVNGERETRPFGGNPVGLITYTADGRMWAALMDPARGQVPTRTLSAAPVRSRAAAAAGYLSYAGTYTRNGDSIAHHVELSLNPNWVDTDEIRLISWADNDDGSRDLVLSTPPTPTDTGRTAVNRLRWRRADDQERMR